MGRLESSTTKRHTGRGAKRAAAHDSFLLRLQQRVTTVTPNP